jgi:hypothetical protein
MATMRRHRAPARNSTRPGCVASPGIPGEGTVAICRVVGRGRWSVSTGGNAGELAPSRTEQRGETCASRVWSVPAFPGDPGSSGWFIKSPARLAALAVTDQDAPRILGRLDREACRAASFEHSTLYYGASTDLRSRRSAASSPAVTTLPPARAASSAAGSLSRVLSVAGSVRRDASGWMGVPG